MKKTLLSIIFTLSVLSAFADKDVRFHMKNGEVKCIAQERVDSIFFDDTKELVIIAFDTYRREQLAIADVDSIKYAVLPQMVGITYTGNAAMVVNPFAFDSVAVDINGARLLSPRRQQKRLVTLCREQVTTVVSRSMARVSITCTLMVSLLPTATALPSTANARRG